MSLPGPLRRRFEAVLFDWDGTAVLDRQVDAHELRTVVEQCCAAGLDLVVVSGTHVGNVDGQLRARPQGPGTLQLALNRGSELFCVGADGVRLQHRRSASEEENAALDHAAALTTSRLTEHGLPTRLISARLNRRKLDLMPGPEWEDPPKSRLPQLLDAVETRLRSCGVDGLREVVSLATEAAREAGLGDPRVTSDAKHVEIGLTDKSDSALRVFDELWQRGIAPSQVLICGDELGSLGGSDALLRVARATVVSVGPEPEGPPPAVVHLGGGPSGLMRILEDQLARRRRRDPPSVADEPGWALRVTGIDPPQERVREALLALGDGRTATRASLAGPAPGADPGVRIAGVYRGRGAESELLTGPAWNVLACSTAVRADRRLDLRTGTLRQEIQTDAGPLEIVQFSSLADPAAMAMRAAAPHGVLRAAQGLVGTDLARPPSDTAAVDDPPGWIGAAISDTRAPEAPPDEERLERLAAYDWRGGGTTGPGDPAARVQRLAANGYERLLREHRSAWAARWSTCDVCIDGDPELQLATRLAIYHLIASTPDRGEGPVGARGLTGDAYRGHVFWDAEAFVLPFHAATHAAAARAMLEYRIRRLPTAIAEARRRRHRGARFPWESGADGEEITPQSALSPTGEVVPIRTGELEDHITADIAWAANCYATWTGDGAFMRGDGRALLVETARFWASRIVIADGRAHIRGVIGPDEYHEDVSDNAYTNVMARWNLRAAARVVEDDAGSAAERAHWRSLADALVDGYDPASGVYEQFAGFSALEPLRIAELAPRRPVAAPLLLGTDRVAGAQVLKQADVLMLHYLLPSETAPGSLPANLDFYEPLTAHGSTLSPGVHAALMARAGRPEQALHWLRTAATIDLDDVGDTTAGGVHLAAMGSAWRAAAWGFAGVSPGTDALLVDPRPLPAQWRSLMVRVVYRGTPVEVRLDAGGVRVTPAGPVAVRVAQRGVERLGSAGRRFPLTDAELACA